MAHTLFPLGELQKSEVRALARRLKLPAAERPESQDICFGDYKALVESYASGNQLRGGDVVDRSGKVLGRHSGIHGVTIGQRKGLGISASRPLYVVDIEAESKRVVVGAKEDLGCKGLIAGNINWLDPFDESEIAAEVQIRYRSPAIRCVVRRTVEELPKFVLQKIFLRLRQGRRRSFIVVIVYWGWVDHASNPRVADCLIPNIKFQMANMCDPKFCI